MCPAEEHQYGEERGDPSSLDLAYVRASAGRRGRNVGAEQAGLSVAFYTASVRRPCVLHLPEGTPTGTPSDRPSSWGRDGEYRGVVRVPQLVFQRLLPERSTAEEIPPSLPYQRYQFESIAEERVSAGG